MSNVVHNRLIVTGPSDEIDRFVAECIRTTEYRHLEWTPGLDFHAIAPIPPELIATDPGSTRTVKTRIRRLMGESFNDRARNVISGLSKSHLGDCDENTRISRAKKLALDTIGYDNYADWCSVNWGTIQNTFRYSEHDAGPGAFDCTFNTRDVCPIVILRTLTEKYPLLRGVFIGCDALFEWTLVGAFTGGVLVHNTEQNYSQISVAIRFSHYPIQAATACRTALLTMCNETATSREWMTDERISSRALQALQHMGQLIGGDAPYLLPAECTTTVLRLALGNRSNIDLSKDEAHDILRGQRYADFFIDRGLVRTWIDRTLLNMLIHDHWSMAIYPNSTRFTPLDRVKRWSSEWVSDDDLHEWAFITMCRSEIEFDFSDRKTLEANFIAYARDLEADLLAHLRGSTGCSPVALAA